MLKNIVYKQLKVSRILSSLSRFGGDSGPSLHHIK